MRLFFYEHAQNAYHSLKSTKTRTLLTTLGVAIGVASITIILSLSSGITKVISGQVEALGGNIAVVRPGAVTQDFEGLSNPTIQQQYTTSTITETDYLDIEEISGVAAVAPMMLINGSLNAKGVSPAQGTILATTPALEEIAELPIRDGQFIDSVTNRDTAVIGSQLSVDLFGTNQSIGQTFKVRGQSFTIIGVLKPLNNPINYNGVDFDRTAIISLESGKSFHEGIAQIQQINVRVKDPARMPRVIEDIQKKLTSNHTGEKDFTILAGEDIAKPSSQFFVAITATMATIAAISLVVGGIGIMNIMLVGVAERTREIGLRKSVGASNGNIVWQFLTEALIISSLGGVLGYIGGYLIAFMISTVLPFSPAITWSIALAALGTSVIVGVIFGIYPAIRAARKDPIESLRKYH